MKIKVGDIFYENRGIAKFYQVIKVYESGRIRIRKIESEEYRTECSYEFLATPLPNKFCPKEEISELGKLYADIIDNDKGAVKLVKYLNDNTPFIEFYGGFHAYLYDGKPIISSYYDVWVR